MIKSDDLFFKMGQAYLNINKGTKGGKPRLPKLGKTEVKQKKLEMDSTKKGRLFNVYRPIMTTIFIGRLMQIGSITN